MINDFSNQKHDLKLNNYIHISKRHKNCIATDWKIVSEVGTINFQTNGGLVALATLRDVSM